MRDPDAATTDEQAKQALDDLIRATDAFVTSWTNAVRRFAAEPAALTRFRADPIPRSRHPRRRHAPSLARHHPTVGASPPALGSRPRRLNPLDHGSLNESVPVRRLPDQFMLS